MAIQIDDNNIEIAKVTWVSVLTNIFLCIIKFIFGFIGNSQAVIADAIHSLSDLSTDFAIIIGVKFWSRPPDDDHPHGHYKIETIITIIIGIIIFCVASGISYHSIMSIHIAKAHQTSWSAFYAAIISIIFKEVLYRWTKQKGKDFSSSAVIANAYHHRSDAISSIPAAFAVLFSSLFPEFAFIDQIGAIIVSVIIYKSAFDIIWPSLSKLIDTGLPRDQLLTVYNIVKNIDGVQGVHDIRTRHIGSMKVACDLHIEVNGNLTVSKAHDIYSEVKKALFESNLPLVDIIVHIDPHRNY